MSVNERRAVDVEWIRRRGSRPWLPCGMACTVVGLALWPLSAAAQTPPPPPTPPAQGLLDCTPIIGQPLVKVPELVSGTDGVLRGTIVLADQQVRMAFRTPPGFGMVPGLPGTYQVCQPQYVRYLQGVGAVPPPPPGPGPYPNPIPGPTLRARVGDIVNLTFLNQIRAGNFGDSIDRAENGIGSGCDQSTGGATDSQGNVIGGGYPASAGDVFPDCLHGSSTGNIHFHGTHTNPNGTGDNVFIEVRPSPQVNGQPTVTAASVKDQFDRFFGECTQRLRADPLAEWPKTWNDPPLGPPNDPGTWTAAQMRLLLAYDQGRPPSQQLWPVDQQQYEQGIWPQYYIGAYPYCFRLPEYTSRTWPPTAAPMAHAGAHMAPMAPTRTLRMGQSPGTHWYHAHKHGSTAINVANGMTGAFIIEGKYDDELNTAYMAYGRDWTRKQPVLVINQLGVSPNLLRRTPTDKGPDFSVNGGMQPKLTMYPGEVQLWRILNTSGRSGAFFLGPPAGFEWKQLAQDGVQFADVNYQKSQNQPFLMASGNRVDLLVKAPAKAPPQSYNVQVKHAVAQADLASANPVTLFTVDVTGSGPEMQLLRRAPTPPPYLADITDDEIKGTKSIIFTSLAPGSPFQHTINGQPFNGEVGEVVRLNTAEEWKISNGTVAQPIDHPFHIHINPFQVTEVFDPNEMITDPKTGKQVNKYVFDKPTVDGQCQLDPNNPDSWKPCQASLQPYRIWWDVFPIPTGRQISVFGRSIVVPGYFKMRSRFVDFPGLFVMHCHILAHEDRGMMMVVEVRPLKMPYAHQ